MYTIEELGIKKQEYDPKWCQEHWFYKDKNGNIIPYFKEDIIAIINPLKPSTFLPFLKLFDIPFIEEEWMEMVRTISENPFQKNGKLIFGRYLTKMKLPAYKSLGFKDSILLSYKNIEDFIDSEYYIQSTVYIKSV